MTYLLTFLWELNELAYRKCLELYALLLVHLSHRKVVYISYFINLYFLAGWIIEATLKLKFLSVFCKCLKLPGFFFFFLVSYSGREKEGGKYLGSGMAESEHPQRGLGVLVVPWRGS